MIRAAQLRNALPPRRTTYAERVAIAPRCAGESDVAISDNATPIDLNVNAPAPQQSRGTPPPPDAEELLIVTASLIVFDTGWVIQAATIPKGVAEIVAQGLGNRGNQYHEDHRAGARDS
jgi:hypothetical protein